MSPERRIGWKEHFLSPILVFLLFLCLALLPGLERKATSDSVYKLANANPVFNMGQLVQGDYTLTRQSDNRYLVLRETGFLFFWFLDSYWNSFQRFSEAPRDKLISLEVEMEGYQRDSQEVWYVQFYDYQAGNWNSTWYRLGAFPTQGEAVLRVQVADPALASRFVGAAGEFRMRFADQGTVSFNFETNRTTLYIDLLRIRFVYDVSPPTSSITYPPDVTYTNASHLTITGTASDQGIDRSGVAAVEISLNGGREWLPTQPQAPGDYSVWSYDWSSIPSEGTYMILSRAIDRVGNQEVPGPGSLLVVDWTPPVVGSVSPPPGAQNVGVNASLIATFQEENPMDEGSINSFSFTLVDEEGNPVPGTVNYDPANKTASFVPSQPLYYGYTYTATLSSAIKDLAGNPLQSYSWSFRTADILLFSLKDSYNRDGSPGNGGVDFGLVGPEGSPFQVGGGNPPYAVSFQVLSSMPWNIYLQASSSMVDDNQNPPAELPVDRLSWALSGSGMFTPFTSQLVPVFNTFQPKTPQPGGRPIRFDLRLDVRWEDQVGDYSGRVTFVLLSEP